MVDALKSMVLNLREHLLNDCKYTQVLDLFVLAIRPVLDRSRLALLSDQILDLNTGKASISPGYHESTVNSRMNPA